MIFFSLADFYKMTEAESKSLTYLRGIRDALAEPISYEARSRIGEEADELVEELVTFYSPHSAAAQLINVLGRSNPSLCADVEVLQKIVFRIARLEREGCGRHIESELILA